MSVTAETGIVATIAVSCRHRIEASGIVAGGSISHCTGIGATIPASGAGQGLGNGSAAIGTHIFTLTGHIVGELRPLCIAWYVPARGTDTPHAAGVA